MSTVVTKHDLLERKANVVRARLLRTLDALDRRRHHVTDVGAQVTDVAKKAALPVGMGIGVFLTIGSGIALALHRRAERARRRHLGYWLGRAFAPPPPPRASFFLEALRKTALAVLVTVATEIAKRQAAQLAQGVPGLQTRPA